MEANNMAPEHYSFCYNVKNTRTNQLIMELLVAEYDVVRYTVSRSSRKFRLFYGY